MKEQNIGYLSKRAVDPNKKVGDEIGQCRGTILSFGPTNVKALVYPTPPDCESCLFSDHCSQSLDKRKTSKV